MFEGSTRTSYYTNTGMLASTTPSHLVTMVRFRTAVYAYFACQASVSAVSVESMAP